MRATRKTWRTGGILLGVSGVLMLVGRQYLLDPFALRLLVDLAWAAGVLVLALGFSREASVVARRPLGVLASVVVAVAPLAAGLVVGALPDVVSAADPSIAVTSAVSVSGTVVSLAAGLVLAVQVARVGAVPRRWRWMPMWALAVSVGAAALQYVAFALLLSNGAGQEVLVPTSLLGLVGLLAPTLGLGVVALVAAASLRPDSVDVYRPA